MEQKDIEKICSLQSNKKTYINQLNQLKKFENNWDFDISNTNHKLYIGDEELINIILHDIEIYYKNNIEKIENYLKDL